MQSVMNGFFISSQAALNPSAQSFRPPDRPLAQQQDLPLEEGMVASTAPPSLPPSEEATTLVLTPAVHVDDSPQSHSFAAALPGSDEHILTETQGAMASLSLSSVAMSEVQEASNGDPVISSTPASSLVPPDRPPLQSILDTVGPLSSSSSQPIASNPALSPLRTLPWEQYDAVQVLMCSDDLLTTHYRMYETFMMSFDFLKEPHRIISEQRTALVLYNFESEQLEVKMRTCAMITLVLSPEMNVFVCFKFLLFFL